jgi:hypothetical protein
VHASNFGILQKDPGVGSGILPRKQALPSQLGDEHGMVKESFWVGKFT